MFLCFKRVNKFQRSSVKKYKYYEEIKEDKVREYLYLLKVSIITID